MNILGIIAEYNPFHNGHLYHLTQAKKLCQPDVTIAVISSSFLQRGEPAIITKWPRALIAVKQGIDLVVELPFIYACSSAEHFARGGIGLLGKLGCTHYAFGSEINSIDILKHIAQILIKEPSSFKVVLKEKLQLGNSFPQAVKHALNHYLTINNTPQIQQYEKAISSPNTILAIQYLKKQLNHYPQLIPILIPRKGAEYLDTTLDKEFVSATGIRNNLKTLPRVEYDYFLKQVMPSNAAEILQNAFDTGLGPIEIEALGPLILSKLRSSNQEELREIPDYETGLEHRILRIAEKAKCWESLLQNLQTKRYVKTRLQRFLIYALCNIKTKDLQQALFNNEPLYIRPLAFNNQGRKYLKKLKKAAAIPVLNRINPRYLSSANQAIRHSLKLEVRANNILTLLNPSIHQRKGGGDFRQPPLFDRS